MPRYLDDNDTEYDRDAERLADEPDELTCNSCGQGGLHWRRVTLADGRSEVSRLFDDQMRRHVCKPSPDDFDVIPGG